jgi:hypothetical protein
MLFVAPASATTGLAIACGLGSFLVALESIVARRRTMALKRQIADLTNQLERADQRRQILEIKASGLHATETEPRLHPLDTRGLTPPTPERCSPSKSFAPS